MKTNLAVLLVLTLLLLVGCQRSPATEGKQPDKQDAGITSQTPSTNANEAQQPASATTPLTREQAQQLALDHAGFTTDQVTRLRAELDRDDRIKHYDVEFYQGDHEYDYEIHAETGEVLSWERDRND